MKIKKYLKKIVFKHSKIYNFIYYCYSLVTDFDGREHVLRKGDNKPVFFVIRPRTNGIEGLLALFIYILKKYEYAVNKEYEVIIDMKNYYTQYSNGKDNVWEWFFTQPSSYSLDDIYSISGTIILSGYKYREEENEQLFSNQIFTDKYLNRKCYQLFNNNFKFSKEVNDMCITEQKSIPIEECIGVFLRGTDYVSLKPTGENMQPTAEQMVDKIRQFQNQYDNPPIFLVTEDQIIYNVFEREFRDLLYTVSFDTYIGNYTGNDYLSKSGVLMKDGHRRGLEYLCKIILLSKCRYMVSSIACGSKVAYVLNNNKYKDEYIFDLGLYK